MSRAELKRAIQELPLSDRVDLLEEIWREAEGEQPGLLDWQREILDQRIQQAEAHPEDWVPWDEATLTSSPSSE